MPGPTLGTPNVPDRFEHRARARKATKLAAALVVAGCDADTAMTLDATGWARAASVAGVPSPSSTTQAAVITLLVATAPEWLR